VAGVSVSWRATSGTVSLTESLTDASGLAITYWMLRNADGTAGLGTHQARATVSGLPPVTFTGHARWGMMLESVSFSPGQVSVASGAATVGVTIHATADIGDVYEGVFRFFSASGQVTPYARLDMTSGTGKDGIWQGTVEIPQNAEPGVWRLEIILRSTSLRVLWPASALEAQGLPTRLTVTAGP
jgi:hypothetical protein